MNVSVEFDKPTAVRVAEFFQRAGMVDAATRLWLSLCASNPYDLELREKTANHFFDAYGDLHAPGTRERGEVLLKSISRSFPIKKLADAYFDNLAQLLRSQKKLERPGRVVLATGTGRCGSTTLAAAVAQLEGACATHENPPPIFWEPHEAQVRFHMDRFRLLADYFPLVFDAAHWWINVLERFTTEFPEGRIIGLVRNTRACARSFLKIKGQGIGSVNHWGMPENGIWASTLWDPVYPSYPLTPNMPTDPDASKALMLERYVSEFNARLNHVAGTLGERLLIVRTEEMSAPSSLERLSAVVGRPLTMPASLNVGTASDSEKREMRF